MRFTFQKPELYTLSFVFPVMESVKSIALIDRFDTLHSSLNIYRELHLVSQLQHLNTQFQGSRLTLRQDPEEPVIQIIT